jgi:hypothetical protein
MCRSRPSMRYQEGAVHLSNGSSRATCRRNRLRRRKGPGLCPKPFDFKAGAMKPTKVTRGGEGKIIDSKTFPVTPISAAIVTLKPGGCVHWHPNADEWQCYITGKGRMTVFAAGSAAHTMISRRGTLDMAHTPHLLMNRHLAVGMSMLDGVPKQEAVVTQL